MQVLRPSRRSLRDASQGCARASNGLRPVPRAGFGGCRIFGPVQMGFRFRPLDPSHLRRRPISRRTQERNGFARAYRAHPWRPFLSWRGAGHPGRCAARGRRRQRPRGAAGPRRAGVEPWKSRRIDSERPRPPRGSRREERASSGHQLGPGARSRAMAIVLSLSSRSGERPSTAATRGYTGCRARRHDTSMKAPPSGRGARQVIASYPSCVHFDEFSPRPRRSRTAGRKGRDRPRRRAAAGRSSRCAPTRLRHPSEGEHRNYIRGRSGPMAAGPDQHHRSPLERTWARVQPFALARDQFRIPPPPALDSPETRRRSRKSALGGDASHADERTAIQSSAGIYGYVGLPSLCAPPRLYTRSRLQIAGTGEGIRRAGECSAGQHGRWQMQGMRSGSRSTHSSSGGR
jgi:hypothetical protein